MNPLTHQPLSHVRGIRDLGIVGRRRVADENRILMSANVARDFSINAKALWEQKTTEQLKAQTIHNISREMRSQQEQRLNARRARLAELLTEDDNLYRLELASLQETSAERAKRQIIEARKMKQEREKKRQQYANECYERQWKEGCDDLRTIDSAFFKIHCHDGVVKQMDEKQERFKQFKEDEARYAAEWENERIRNVAREDAKAAARAAAIIENRRDLKNQMDEQERAAHEAHIKQQKDKEDFQRILDADAAAARKKAIELSEKKRAAQTEIVSYNEKLQEARRLAFEKQREEERRDLHEKMEEYKEDEERHRADQQFQQKEIREFRAYLARRKEEEAIEEAEMERLVKEDLDRANAKRDLNWEKERLAREKLMRDVYKTRGEQIQEKLARQARDDYSTALEKRAAELELARAAEESARDDAEERESILNRRRDLEAQIAINRHRQSLEAQLIEREKEAARQADIIYQQKLDKFRADSIQNAKRNYGIRGAK